MIGTRYVVRNDDEMLGEFETKNAAIEFAKQQDGTSTIYVEMIETDADGLGNEYTMPAVTIWSSLDFLDFDDNTQPEILSQENEFNTDFPDSDIIDFPEDDWVDDTVPADWDDVNRFPKKNEDLNIKEAVDKLEENESEVECKCCFDLFPKEDCIKTEQGYLCKKCDQEMHSHQGTNLDLIDADPFNIEYDDPRFPEERPEVEVKEEPVNGNEVRKHEKAIEESQSQEIGDYYKKTSKKYNIDLDELVYGENGFMKTCYPEGFPDFKGDVIYSEKYWTEFENWLRNTHGIELNECKKPLEESIKLSESKNKFGPLYLAYINKKPVGYIEWYALESDEFHPESEKVIAAIKRLFEVKDENAEIRYENVDADSVDSKLPFFTKDKITEHVNEEHPAIESNQELHGMDNAVVDCQTDMKVIAHSEDEKPLDCKMKKPVLEKPLTENAEALREQLHQVDTPYDVMHFYVDRWLDCDVDPDYMQEIFELGLKGKEFPTDKVIDEYKGKDYDYVEEIYCLGEDILNKGLLAVLHEIDATIDSTDPDGQELLEAKKDEKELPPDPGAVKVEVHGMLNDLVADEIEAIDGYEAVKTDLMDKPIEHKDEIIDTLDHIKDEEKEHIDELINAASEIPFDKEAKVEAPIDTKIPEEPAEELPVEEENPFEQEFESINVYGEPLIERSMANTPFDSDIKIGDKIRISHLDGEDTSYDGREGTVEHIDDIGQLHGTWGGLAVIPGVDEFEIINESLKENLSNYWFTKTDIDYLNSEAPGIDDENDQRLFVELTLEEAAEAAEYWDDANKYSSDYNEFWKATAEAIRAKISAGADPKAEIESFDLDNDKLIININEDSQEGLTEYQYADIEELLKDSEAKEDNWLDLKWRVGADRYSATINYDADKKKYKAHISVYHAGEDNNVENVEGHTDELEYSYDSLKALHNDLTAKFGKEFDSRFETEVDYKCLALNLFTESSSAETKAFKKGGQALHDLIQGRAIGRIKNKAARDAAIAAVKAGRDDVVHSFTGDRHEEQASAAYEKKAKAMLDAGVTDEEPKITESAGASKLPWEKRVEMANDLLDKLVLETDNELWDDGDGYWQSEYDVWCNRYLYYTNKLNKKSLLKKMMADLSKEIHGLEFYFVEDKDTAEEDEPISEIGYILIK